MKKGFTLVELLAVIVILAVILAIALPSISNMIKSSAERAFESDAKMLLKQVGYSKMGDVSFESSSIDTTTIENFNISNDNYEYLKVGSENGTDALLLIGKNKWDGLIACGTLAKMKTAKENESISCGVSFDFKYNGDSQTMEIPISGTYLLEAWGASGGDGRLGNASEIMQSGGAGGYSSGNINLSYGTNLYIYVGGKGEDQSKTTGLSYGKGGFNGGADGGAEESGESMPEAGAGGGGATDFRLSGSDLTNRILVAGGGGGAASSLPSSVCFGGVGGGLNGTTTNTFTIAGAQTSGYQLGIGKVGYSGVNGTNYGAFGGGGGGYYGGTWNTTSTTSTPQGGAGGSGYIGGVTGGQTIIGNTSIPSPSWSTEKGHIGNGYARVTFIGN